MDFHLLSCSINGCCLSISLLSFGQLNKIGYKIHAKNKKIMKIIDGEEDSYKYQIFIRLKNREPW